MGILKSLKAVTSILDKARTSEGGFTDAIMNMTKDEADVAAETIKSLNVFAEEHPTTSNVLGVSSMVDYIDQKAYDVGSQSDYAIREAGDLSKRVEDYAGGSYSDLVEAGTIPQTKQQYTGYIHQPSDSPNLLKIFLGMEENTLPMSDVSPSSWTKDTPEQGWRSIKEFSGFGGQTNLGRHKGEIAKGPYYEAFKMGGAATHDEWISTSEKEQFINLRKSVDEGTYNPSEHAIKLDFSVPGIEYGTDVNLGHFTESIGYDVDKEEYYFSVTDVWDFEPDSYEQIWGRGKTLSQHAYTQSSLMQAAGKSVGIYDRYPIPKEAIKLWSGDFSENTITDALIDRFKED